jgi:hypothetical protein
LLQGSGLEDPRKNVEETMTIPSAERPPEEPRRKPDLDCRYGQIGISAVAAALNAGSDDKDESKRDDRDTPEHRAA